MTYDEFLENIDSYVGYIVEFTAIWTKDGNPAGRFQRYVWDNKEFGKPSADRLMDITNVEIIRKAETRRTKFGMNYIV